MFKLLAIAREPPIKSILEVFLTAIEGFLEEIPMGLQYIYVSIIGSPSTSKSTLLIFSIASCISFIDTFFLRLCIKFLFSSEIKVE